MPKRKVVRSDSESESQGSGSESDEFESMSEESDEPLQKKPKLSKTQEKPGPSSKKKQPARKAKGDSEDKPVSIKKPTFPASSSKAKAKAKAETDDESEAGDEEKVVVEKSSDGEKYINLGGKKRVSVSNFKGNAFVNIREYYTTPDGEEKPGKKGIALQKAQWDILKKGFDTIDELFNAQLKK